MFPKNSLLLCFVLCCHAHEIGTSRVSVHLENGHNYDILIVTDAVSLVDKLHAVNGHGAGFIEQRQKARGKVAKLRLPGFVRN